jgi:hypothetical protein
MPVRIRTKLPEYLPATQIHRQLRIGPVALLRLVVNGAVKAKIDPRWTYPVYCVADCKAAYSSRPRQHQPDALTHTNRGGGRPRKAKVTS